jgi:DNA-binding Lrp family transcriptional regulator
VITAYILIQVAPGRSSLFKQIGQIKGVLSAEAVSGPYDIIARAEARTLDELAQTVLRNVQALSGVTRTLTCPVPKF